MITFRIVLVVIVMCLMEVNTLETEENNIIEARGKAKYALLTHLVIVMAAKIGLYKIFLGIALVVTTIKAMVVMAWTMTVAKHVPDYWLQKIHFFYVAATKLFVLKIVYGIIFFIVVKKAWHLVIWLTHYVKEKKHDHYVEPAHVYGRQPYYYDNGYGRPGIFAGYHQPYSAYDKPSYGLDYLQKKEIYDADGSYSVGGS